MGFEESGVLALASGAKGQIMNVQLTAPKERGIVKCDRLLCGRMREPSHLF